MLYTELMSGLATESGLVGLAPDENGVVSLDIDGMVVIITEAGSGSALVIRGDAGELPPEGQEGLRKMLLEGNLAMSTTTGESFGSDSQSGRVFLLARESISSITLPDFIRRLESFINALESWRRVIADFRQAADAKQASGESPTNESTSGGFMRV